MRDQLTRTTLMVRDITAARQWYEHVFRMQLAFEMPMTLTSDLLAAGKPGDQMMVSVMKCESEAIGMIGLLQWVSPQYAAPDRNPERLPFHAPILVASSPDIHATFERAQAAGSKIQSAPHDLAPALADGQTDNRSEDIRSGKVMACSFWDLDGHFFEVFETET